MPARSPRVLLGSSQFRSGSLARDHLAGSPWGVGGGGLLETAFAVTHTAREGTQAPSPHSSQGTQVSWVWKPWGWAGVWDPP